MSLDPNGRYLQHDDGTIYVWNEALAKRKDMREYDPKTKSIVSRNEPNQNVNVPLTLQGETFSVLPRLKELVEDLLLFVDEIKAENEPEKEKIAKKDQKKGK